MPAVASRGQACARVDNTIVKAIARAYRWRKLLEIGRSKQLRRSRRLKVSILRTCAGSCVSRSFRPELSRPYSLAAKTPHIRWQGLCVRFRWSGVSSCKH